MTNQLIQTGSEEIIIIIIQNKTSQQLTWALPSPSRSTMAGKTKKLSNLKFRWLHQSKYNDIQYLDFDNEIKMLYVLHINSIGRRRLFLAYGGLGSANYDRLIGKLKNSACTLIFPC